MDAIDSIRERIRLVSGAEGQRRHLLHPLNGRFHPVDHAALDTLVQALALRVDVAAVDYVLGFPEGGSIPAYAFARLVGRPVILASRLPLDLPGRIAFEQPGARLGTTQYLYGLSPGHRVVIVEDELTSGVSAVNAIRALRAAGVLIGQVAALFVIDHPSLWRRLDAEGVTLHTGLTLPPEYAPRSVEAEPGVIRVAFFAALPFHGPILAAVRDALGARAETRLLGDRRAVVAFRPQVLVMASSAHLEYFRHHLPGTFVANVRHGLIGKQGLSRLPGRSSARRFDAVCVGDERRKAHYARVGARPEAFWETGYPQLDALFRRDPAPPLPLDPAQPTLLYAPTWNLGLTSATMLGERLVDLVRARVPGLNVIIKPHPVIGDWRPRWMARWQRMAAAHPGVHLVEETHVDVVPYCLAADILLSDASSVIFEFLALDRPIILLTNPRHTADPAWLPDDVVWRWRDVGYEIGDVSKLPEAVAAALADPAAGQERRRVRARELFGAFTDGHNAGRVAEHILEAGARVAGGERSPAATPPPLAWRWHDLRTRLRQHAAVRRLAFGPLEGVRLAFREWRGVGRPIPAADRTAP